MEALEESIAAFNEQVDLGQVTAPFAGTVDRIFAKEGEMASPMQPVVRVLDLEEMYVRASVSDHYVGAVSEGQRVDIVVPGMDTLSSSIGRVGRYIEMANRTFEIVVPIAGDHGLLPNQFVSLRINDLHVDTALTLPSSLILRTGRQGLRVPHRKRPGQATARHHRHRIQRPRAHPRRPDSRRHHHRPRRRPGRRRRSRPGNPLTRTPTDSP